MSGVSEIWSGEWGRTKLGRTSEDGAESRFLGWFGDGGGDAPRNGGAGRFAPSLRAPRGVGRRYQEGV